MKDILKNKKKMLIITLVAIVVIFLGVAVFLLTRNDSNSNSLGNNNPGQVEGNTNLPQTKPTEVSTFEVSNFKVKKNTPNEVNMVFVITNKSKEDILEKTLKVNMYDSEKLIYTYNRIISNLKVEEYIYIQANARFEYDKVTKFEFQIDDSKATIKPTYVD